ncbi:hypothetical protein B566_EDAN009082 [Ephemera danica]|nr:hypothetical protein B566_EDAN009082 [Ephemera danica]
MNVSIGVLSIAEDKKTKLKEKGFLNVQDVLSSDAAVKHLLRDVEENELKELKEKPHIQSALELWKDEVSKRPIITFCSQLDTLLGGGIELEAITDFCGAPGTGKTQICHQLCIDVQLPEHLGGVNGQAIFIDTNYSFSYQRLKDMAEACMLHCQWMQKECRVRGTLPGVTDFLSGVHVSVLPEGSLSELLATLTNLNEALQSLPKVKLLIIDSFSKPFLLYSEDLQKRTALIFETLILLQNLAWKFKLAVVTTSQLTTMLKPDNEATVVPGLGQGFAHQITHRVLLGHLHKSAEPRRAAQMLKSPSRPNSSAFFKISNAGVRDEGV